jgi:hypothetical protein
MHTHGHFSAFPLRAVGLIALLCLAPIAGAQAAETITATAKVKTRGGAETASPVKITIDRFSTDAERQELLAALKASGTEGVKKLLSTRSQIGSIQVGTQQTPLKHIFARSTGGGGRLITAVSGSPIAFASAQSAPAKAGFDLGLIIVDIVASGGHGELMPATKVKLDDQGALVTDGYNDEVVQLTNIGK